MSNTSTTRPRQGDAAESTGAAGGPDRASRASDLAYGAFYGGALGGSIIALFFLVVDAIQGQALYTPSMLGAALFLDTTTTAVRVDMVALFSIVHFVTFFALGGVASWLHLTWEPLRDRMASLGIVLFVLLTGALFLGSWLFMDGVVASLGIFEVLLANALTAAAMAAFITRALPG